MIGGHFFLSNGPQGSIPIQLNGTIETVCTILKHVASSAAEAELGGLFNNAQKANILKEILKNMGWQQQSIPINYIKPITTSIDKNTMHHNRSHFIDMIYILVVDQTKQKITKAE